MRNPHGYIKVTEGVPHKGGDVLREADTFQCSHCGRHVLVKSGANLDTLGNMCPGCMKMICPECENRRRQRGCVTLEQSLQREEARFAALRSYGLA